MTNVNEDFYNLVAQFKKVRLMMSIDGTGDTFDYIRYPGKWKQIDKNIHKLIDFVNNLAPHSKHPKDHLKFELQLAPVLQLLNLLMKKTTFCKQILFLKIRNSLFSVHIILYLEYMNEYQDLTMEKRLILIMKEVTLLYFLCIIL